MSLYCKGLWKPSPKEFAVIRNHNNQLSEVLTLYINLMSSGYSIAQTQQTRNKNRKGE
jgi:hypothetical protein